MGDKFVRQDMLKTIAGIVVVGLVVVATYLYGNHQSQVAQQKQQALEQSQQPVKPVAKPAPKPVPAPAAPAKPASTPTASATTPAASKPIATTQTATSGPQPSTIPQTGGVIDLVPLAALVGAAQLYRRSRHWQSSVDSSQL